MKLVSKWTMSIRRKDISFRVFSKMIRGSSDWQRRQFGAMTIAKLFTSILVLLTFTGWAKTWHKRKTEHWNRCCHCVSHRRAVFTWHYLKEVDEVAEHESVELRERLNHTDGCIRIFILTDALLIDALRNHRLLQLPVPQLQQRRWRRERERNLTFLSCLSIFYRNSAIFTLSHKDMHLSYSIYIFK